MVSREEKGVEVKSLLINIFGEAKGPSHRIYGSTGGVAPSLSRLTEAEGEEEEDVRKSEKMISYYRFEIWFIFLYFFKMSQV